MRPCPARALLGEQLAELKTQHDQITEQEQKLVQTSQELQSLVERFRTQQEPLKASPTAAQAQTKVGEAVEGISTSMGWPEQSHRSPPQQEHRFCSAAWSHRRSGRLGRAGRLADMTPNDDIQRELDKVSRSRSTTSSPPSRPSSGRGWPMRRRCRSQIRRRPDEGRE